MCTQATVRPRSIVSPRPRCTDCLFDLGTTGVTVAIALSSALEMSAHLKKNVMATAIDMLCFMALLHFLKTYPGNT